MILPRHPSGDQDDDPTGVRALLSSLPEPEPMPEDLVHRITASLAAEQAARGQREAIVLPLTVPRRRGRRVLTAVAVAAGIAAVGVAGAELLPLAGSSQTSAGAASSAGAQLAASPDSGRKASSPAWSGAMHIEQSGTRYTTAAFVEQATSLASRPASDVTPLTGEAQGAGPIATPQGLADCLTALGVNPSADVTADLAFFDGTPAVALVTLRGGHRTAYAVLRSCRTGAAGVLHAATTLP